MTPEQVGPAARNLADAAALQDIIAGTDLRDATSLREDAGSMTDALGESVENVVKGLRVAVIDEILAEDYDEDGAGELRTHPQRA